MKVKMKATTYYQGKKYLVGQEAIVSDAVGQRWTKAKIAEEIKTTKKKE